MINAATGGTNSPTAAQTLFYRRTTTVAASLSHDQ
jgi:hypothetical protein